jgi:Na+-translocating ferredoxin:NAD+ oxidoreductase RnfD subunit
MKLPSLKTQLIVFLACFALYLSIIDKVATFLLSLSIAVVSTVVIDSLIIYLRQKKFLISESSVISGLIIGYVLASDTAWWVIVLTSLLAIGSKHLIRIHKKHLFNPAAFGIFLSIILFGVSTQWRGTYIWYIIIPAGIYFAYKIRKIEILIGYFITFLILFGTQALLKKVNLLNIFGYLSYFYIFIMVIEPKTTPIKPLGKFIFGIGVCAIIFLLTELGARFDVELLSLLIMNMSVPLLNKLPNFRK